MEEHEPVVGNAGCARADRTNRAAPRHPGRRRCSRTFASDTGSRPRDCRGRSCGSRRVSTRMRDHALGLPAATAAKPDHSSLTYRWCSSTPWPSSARSAVSNSGYTIVGATARCAISYSLEPGVASPMTSSHGGSSPVSQSSSTRGSSRAPASGCACSRRRRRARRRNRPVVSGPRTRRSGVAGCSRRRSRPRWRGRDAELAREQRARVRVAPRTDGHHRHDIGARQERDWRAPVSASAARAASASSSIGGLAASGGTRWLVCPTPTMTGARRSTSATTTAPPGRGAPGRAGRRHLRHPTGRRPCTRRRSRPAGSVLETGHAGSPGAALSRQIDR